MHQIQNYLRANTSGVSGPFGYILDPYDDNPDRNYATPLDGDPSPTAAEIADLCALFASQDRMPRLEYVAPAPSLESALQQHAGFDIERRLPLLTVDAESLVAAAVPPETAIRQARTSDEFAAVAAVQNTAYGQAGPADQHDVDRLVDTVAAGGTVVMATRSGQCVGAGMHTRPVDGISEIAAISVEGAHRRQGIAAAIGSELTRSVFAAAATPFIQAEGVAEQGLYQRLGYRPIGAIHIAADRRLPSLPIQTPRATLVPRGSDGVPLFDLVLDEQVIGDCGTVGLPDATGVVEIRFGLAEPNRGRGLGAEMVSSLAGWLLWQPSVTAVVAESSGSNTAARKTLLRAGFVQQYAGDDTRPAGSGDQNPVRYALTAADVAARAASRPDHAPPRQVGDERTTLLNFIGYLRSAIIGKARDLDEQQTTRPGVASGTSLLGLVKHVAAVESMWLHHVFGGLDPDLLFDDSLQPEDTIESVSALAAAVAATSDRIAREAAGMDTRAAVMPFGPPRPTLRWVLVHLVEELARHAGQADIIREQLDGTVGR
jgi:GNAT superfamily N-acetyltransferase/uncharacterized damage-inducible protein DinB